jgi:dTDP-4-dehydrorhamnose 3,5-epimerase
MSARFNFIATGFEGLTVLQRKPIGDARGYLERIFCAAELAEVIGNKAIIQINHTHTAARGTVRGMHYQVPPHSEIKLVSCLRGEVLDVVADVRRGSATFLSWHAEVLSAENHKTLLIPAGFAHGFQTLTEDCEMLYLHTAAHHPGAEAGLHPCDPRMAIHWPLPVGGLSPRDSTHPLLDLTFSGIQP